MYCRTAWRLTNMNAAFKFLFQYFDKTIILGRVAHEMM